MEHLGRIILLFMESRISSFLYQWRTIISHVNIVFISLNQDADGDS